MNDLERDLHELFEQRATKVDAPVLAPNAVLRRGRRRQARTVAGSAIAGVLAIAVAVAAIGVVRRPEKVPLEGPSLPARTTSIDGIPVEAPAGWTLVDDWARHAIIGTSATSCSFTATGVPVDQNGSTAASSSDVTSSGTDEPCMLSPLPQPAGVPVFQLANFEIPLMETVCALDDQGTATSIPPDGVAVYVADLQGAPNIPRLLDSCPGSEDAPEGLLQTGIMDVGHHTSYAAVGVVGPTASSEDIGIARDYIESLSGIEVTPTDPFALGGPGYVIAAGSEGDTSWRLKAGITTFSQEDHVATLGAVLVTTDPNAESAKLVDLPTSQSVLEDSVDLGSAGVVQFGTAKATVTGVDIVDSNGDVTPATLLPSPDGIRTLEGVNGAVDGSIWYAVGDERGGVEIHEASVPTRTDTSPPPTDQPVAERLSTSVNSEGVYVISGNDVGHDWELQQLRTGSLIFTIDGEAPDSELRLSPWSSTRIDVPGGAFTISVRPPGVKRIYVTSDVSGTDTIAEGRWAPPADYAPEHWNIWVTPLPGAGVGYVWEGDDALPIAEQWPAVTDPLPGDLLAAGRTDDVLSWDLFWAYDCPQLQVVAAIQDGDTGSAACPVAWDSATDQHEVSSVGGVAGQHHAVVMMTGPDPIYADVQADGNPNAGGSCGGSVANVGPWADTGVCVFVIPVGETWIVQPTNRQEHAFGGAIRITARPGKIDVSGPAGKVWP